MTETIVTVKELIEWLSAINPNAQIFTEGIGGSGPLESLKDLGYDKELQRVYF